MIFRPAETRASMDALVVHEWTTAGWNEPVRRLELEQEAKLQVRQREERECVGELFMVVQEDILQDMESRFGWSREAIEAALAAHHVSSQVCLEVQ